MAGAVEGAGVVAVAAVATGAAAEATGAEAVATGVEKGLAIATVIPRRLAALAARPANHPARASSNPETVPADSTASAAAVPSAAVLAD